MRVKRDIPTKCHCLLVKDLLISRIAKVNNLLLTFVVKAMKYPVVVGIDATNRE